MAKQFKVLVNTGNAQSNQVLDVTQGQGAKGQPLRIAAKAGAKYQLQELDKNKEAAPEYVKVKRVGKNLHILLENSTEADIIIEDYYEVISAATTDEGSVYVMFGQTNPSTMNVNSSTAGFVIQGWSKSILGSPAGAMAGYNVSTAGDVNGDGLADVMFSGYNYGRTEDYVVFGKTDNTTVRIDNLGTNGFKIQSQNAAEQSWFSLSYAGDVNGDGLSDVVLGANNAYSISNGVGVPYVGKSYVVFGKTNNATVDLTAIAGGTGGYVINGELDRDLLGSSVSYAGDINGDGLADLIVGAKGPYATQPGRTFVVYGKTDATAINVSDVAKGVGGFVIQGQSADDKLGADVSNAGDVNGDGYDDLIVGAQYADPTTGSIDAGKTYIIYGGSQFISGNIATATGTASDEMVIGTSSDDTLTGNGGVDRFNAGKGNDTVVLQASDVTNLANNVVGSVKAMVDGGTGFDTLQVSASGVNLDMTTISNVGGMANEGASRINSIERINLGADATANTLTLTAKDVNDMAEFNSIRLGASDDGKTWSNVTGTALSATTKFHQVVVEGTVADTLNLGAGFMQVGTVNNGTATYNVYQNTATNSQVIVDSAISNVVMDLPPTLVSTSPADNAQVAATNLATDLTLTFNEAVKAGTGVIELYNASTNVLVESFDAASSTKVTGWNSTALTINPTSDLTAGTGYYVKVAATAVKDLGGNAYAGITDSTTFNFLTLNSDGSIPVFPPNGGQTGSSLGISVSSAGDVNGDGYDDVIVGAYSTTDAGAAYVVYGNAAGAGVVLTSGTIAPSLGFRISGQAGSYLGTTVSGIGDINGDGFADVLVAANGSLTSTAAAYVVYGSASNSGVNLSSGSIVASSGFKISGLSGTYFGKAVSGGGDVNGDGLADLIIGAPYETTNDNKGASYIVYGNTTGADINLSNGSIGAASGYKISGQTNRSTGWAVSNAGDVNGDGLADQIISAYGSREAYVVYGNSTGTGVDLSGGTISAGQGYKLTGITSVTTQFGVAVSSAGDVNGDGFADVIVGDNGPNATNAGSSAYIIYGAVNGTGVDLNTTGGTITSSRGFKITGPTGTQLGYSIASAGDVNGDGLSDLIVGAPFNDSGVGATYIVYGKTSSTGLNISSGAIAASDGFKLTATTYGYFGNSVSNAGDVNGDGLSDLVIGANKTNSDSGAYYLVLGGTENVTAAANLTGTASDEAVMGTAGNDVLTGNGGVDRFFAGKGNDTIVLSASDAANLASNTGATRATVQGGTGFDTLRLNGTNLDLTTISNVGAMGLEENSRIESIERIDMATDTSANTLTLTAKDVNDMAEFNSIRLGASDDGKTWSNVTGTALSATTKFHQVVVDGTSADKLTLEVGNGYWATRVFYKANGTSGTISDAITFRAWDMTANITEGVYTDTTPRGGKAQFSEASGTVSIDSLAPPTAPKGVNDTASIGEARGLANGTAGTALTSTTSGFETLNVLANDTDVNPGDTKTVSAILKGTTGTPTAVTASTTSANGRSVVGTYGTLVIGADGSYTYAVDNANTTVNALNVGGFVDDVFTYTVKDAGGLTSTATLTVRVDGANDKPTLVTELADPANLVIGTPFSYTIPAGTFTDVDNATLTYSAEDAVNVALPSWLTFNPATRTLSGTPAENDAYTYSIYFKASDGNSYNGTIITLYVPPTAYTFDSLASLTSRNASGSAYTATTKNISLTNSLLNKDTNLTELEYQIYNGSNTGSYINFDSTKLAAGTKMKTITANFQLLLSTTAGDGVAFSFGDKTSLGAISGTPNTANYDWGYSTGLSVEFGHGAIPVVRWNGSILTNTTGTAMTASDTTAYATSITVYHTGVIKIQSNYVEVATATIPGWTSMTAATTADWQFGVSGSTGSNNGTAWMDNLSVSGSRVVGPVVIDLNDDGAVSYSQTAMDVDGDGRLDNTAWVAPEDGVLVWDKLGDGKVHDNSQYAFSQYGGTSDLGGLAVKFDTNRDGVFDADDEKFAEFKVWQDADQDGVSDAGEVRSLADVGITQINLISDGVQRTPVNGVTEVGQSTANMADGGTTLVADAEFAYSTATDAEVAEHFANQLAEVGVTEAGQATATLADASVLSDAASIVKANPVADASDVANATAVAEASTAAEVITAELLESDFVPEHYNKPFMLTDEELAALNPLGQATQTEATTGEVTNVDITPEDVAAAIAVCTGAAESSTYSLSFGQSLDLTTVLKDMSFNGIVKGLEQVDMATDTSANKVSLTLADVLSLPPTNGVHQLMLTGAANDKLMLTEGEWTDTGNVVNQNGQNYAVYSGTTDPSAQLLIDQHMLQSHQTS